MFSFQDFAGAHFNIWFQIFETFVHKYLKHLFINIQIFETFVHKYHSQYSLSSDIDSCASSIFLENTFTHYNKEHEYILDFFLKYFRFEFEA